ncbi:MAG TPA: hypothetical protein VM307_07930 [Egibacteraceae bacterium]|nr:hypothetical protein [Egibacteraceae bacterium]
MYTSPEEDRSDLFLAGAVYILGPQVLGIILGRVPIPAAASPLLSLLLIVATTILVPLLLIRYRKQRLSEFGFAGPPGSAVAGLLPVAPIVAAYVIAGAVAGSPFTAVPLLTAVNGGTWVGFVVQAVAGLCAGLLAVYMTVKARTAFRSDPDYLRPTMWWLGRFAAIAAAVTSLLLLLSVVVRGGALTTGVEILLVPLGVAGAAWLVHQRLSGSQLTTRASLITPMVVLAIGPFTLFGGAVAFVAGLWRAALLAGIGLLIGALIESKRTAWAPLGLAAGLALLTPLLP